MNVKLFQTPCPLSAILPIFLKFYLLFSYLGFYNSDLPAYLLPLLQNSPSLCLESFHLESFMLLHQFKTQPSLTPVLKAHLLYRKPSPSNACLTPLFFVPLNKGFNLYFALQS